MTLKRAAQAYEAFHGDQPGEKIAYTLPTRNVVAWRLGQMTAAAYVTPRDGKIEHYLHEFADGCGPYIDVPIGKKGPFGFFATEGAYDVTDAGFEDDEEMGAALLSLNPAKRGETTKKKGLPTMKRDSKGRFLSRKKRAAPKRKSNPAPRRKSAASTYKRKRRAVAASSGGAVKRYKRNPSRRAKLNLTKLAIDGAVGVAGGYISTKAIAMLPVLPDNMKTGVVGGVMIAVAGGVMGMGISMLHKGHGETFALGGVIAGGMQALGALMANAGMNGLTYDDGTMGAIQYGANMGGIVVDQNGQPLTQNQMGEWVPLEAGSGMGWVTAANTYQDTDFQPMPSSAAGYMM